MQDDNQDAVTPYALVVYEPCSEHIRDLGIRGNRFSFFGSFYTESLLLLNHDDGRIVKCGAVKRRLLEQTVKVAAHKYEDIIF
ncbi:hypothetical protein L6452_08293 [Arctium lappa]|uniref:Uncharacterized protein n=1 Tax=Arctium lappa TaxID=4217 RepID=A0ACB9DH34_ARCLA|nr:hypothetical protein L6452_08293 [Arctium lappa]